MPSVTPVHNWRNKKNRNGRYPIHLRITINRKHKYHPINVPQKVSDSEWSGKDDSWVKNKNPFAFEINDEIAAQKKIALDSIKRFYQAKRSITFPMIFKELKKFRNGESFNIYFADYIKNPKDKIEPDTLKKYRACLDHVNAFNKNIAFHELTNNLIDDFHMYLVKTADLKGSTIDSYFDAFRKVINMARKDQFVSKDAVTEMFEDLKITINEPKRSFLSIQEMKQWRQAEFESEEKHLRRDRDIFLFMFYCGYYYKDMKQLLKTDLTIDHEYGLMIEGERVKGKKKNIIPLYNFEYAQTIIDLYGSKDPLYPYVFREDVFVEEPVFNRNLKEIAERAKILKKPSNKWARHSNAQMYIRLGAKKPILSKMLGHNREATTEAYYRVNPIEVIENTSKMDFVALGI